MFSKFNDWYDGLHEPKRFLIFLVPMVAINVLIAFPKTMFLGLMLLSIMGLAAASRAKKIGHQTMSFSLGITMVVLLVISTVFTILEVMKAIFD